MLPVFLKSPPVGVLRQAQEPSQSVLLWDGLKLEMKRIAKGHTKISILPQSIPLNDVPLYSSTH